MAMDVGSLAACKQVESHLKEEFFVEYLNCGSPQRFEVQGGRLVSASDPRLAQTPPLLLRKFLASRRLPWDRADGVSHGDAPMPRLHFGSDHALVVANVVV